VSLSPFNYGGDAEQHVLMCNGDQLFTLKMVPLASQIEAMIASSLYEQAINLCIVCTTTAGYNNSAGLLQGVDLLNLHELHAQSLWDKGDFDRAINSFTLAKSPLVKILKNCPELIPAPLQGVIEIIENCDIKDFKNVIIDALD
jgi:hypothetical protein